MLKLQYDGTLEFEIEGTKLKGLIRAMATVDDVMRASSLGHSAVIAEEFLPEAVEIAEKLNVRLIRVENLIEPIAEFLIEALANRRPDQLVKFFDSLVPSNVFRHGYIYREFPSAIKPYTIIKTTFEIEFSTTDDNLMEKINILLMRINSKLSRKGLETKLETRTTFSGLPSIQFGFTKTFLK